MRLLGEVHMSGELRAAARQVNGHSRPGFNSAKVGSRVEVVAADVLRCVEPMVLLDVRTTAARTPGYSGSVTKRVGFSCPFPTAKRSSPRRNKTRCANPEELLAR